MSKQRLAAAEAMFQLAVELPVHEREHFLTERCRDDHELRELVTRLLAHHDLAGSFLESPILPAAIPPASTPGVGPLSERPPTFVAGETIAGRYHVQRLLGKGGMGEVYEVWDDDLAIAVALKTLRIKATQDADRAIRHLKQEAMLARAVVHPNVCRVYDLGCHGRTPREAVLHRVWFLTMEILHGQTLQEWLASRAPLTSEEALPLVTQMAAGLEAAHQAGVVHGDFKSGNVMLANGPSAKQAVITDFGLAREARDRGNGKRGSHDLGKASGTPAYMAPEQVRGEAPGTAADIFALGVVLYEMVTGTLPFIGRTPREAVLQRLKQAPVSPRKLVRGLDRRWERTILCCLARDPQKRFARAEDVADALCGLESRTALISSTMRRGHRSRPALPAERDAFFGRDAEILNVTARFTAGARLVTLVGTAGVGKTRVAIHYGRQHLHAWPGGIWFCDLTEARSLDGIASAVARPLGMQLGRGDAVAQLGHAIAARKHCLLIIDNFEQVVGLAAETIGHWLHRAQSATFLVTSRERLNLFGEDVLAIEPLPFDPALALFLERSRQLCPALRLEENELAATKEAVRLTEGLPLAIELAAARLRVMSVTKLVEGMKNRFRLLTGGAGSRHETLAAAIDGSWELLQPWERAAFAQCSVFEGGFTLEAADEVIDVTPWPPAPWVVDVVQSLVDKSLLQVKSPEGMLGLRLPRLGMLKSLQEYARRKLEEDGSVSEASRVTAAGAVKARHGAWYARLGTDDALAELDGEEGPNRRQALYLELDNLVAACHRAISRGDGRTAGAVYRAASDVLHRRGPFRTLIELGMKVLACEMDPELRARALLNVGTAEGRCGMPSEARSHMEDAMAIFRRIGHRSGEAFCLGNVATIDYSTGKFDDALVSFESAIDIQRELGNRQMEGVLRANIGLIHHTQGRLDKARDCFEDALAINRDTGNRRSEGVALSCLGHLHLNQGRMKEARHCFETALKIHRDLGDRPFEGSVLGDLGTLHLGLGLWAEARSFFEASLEIHREVGNRPTEGVILGHLGNLYLDHGLMAEAKIALEAALAINREVGDKRSEGINLTHLGSVHFEEDRIEEAHTVAETALALNRHVGHRRFEGITLGCLGLIYLAQDKLEAAREALESGEAILREMADPLELAKLLSARVAMESVSGDRDKAAATLIEVEAVAERAGVKLGSELHRRLARARELVMQGNHEGDAAARL